MKALADGSRFYGLSLDAAFAFILARDQSCSRKHAADRCMDVVELIGRRMLHQTLGLAGERLHHLVGRAFLWQFLQAPLQARQLGVDFVSGLHGGMVGLVRDGGVPVSLAGPEQAAAPPHEPALWGSPRAAGGARG